VCVFVCECVLPVFPSFVNAYFFGNCFGLSFGFLVSLYIWPVGSIDNLVIRD